MCLGAVFACPKIDGKNQTSETSRLLVRKTEPIKSGTTLGMHETVHLIWPMPFLLQMGSSTGDVHLAGFCDGAVVATIPILHTCA